MEKTGQRLKALITPGTLILGLAVHLAIFSTKEEKFDMLPGAPTEEVPSFLAVTTGQMFLLMGL